MKRLILTLSSSVCAALAFGAVTNITESVRLDADADWRGQGVVKLGEGVTIDLHGHELKTDGYTGPDEPFVDATVADPDRVTSPTTIFPATSSSCSTTISAIPPRRVRRKTNRKTIGFA